MMKQHRNKTVKLLTIVLFLLMFFTVSVQADAGWKQNSNGTWSYYSKTGKLVKRKWLNNRTYYVNKKGVRQIGWLKQKGKYYFFTKSGRLLKNMQFKSDKKMYYAGSDGAVLTGGIHTIGANSYYFSKRGVMLTGKRKSGGNTYYFSKKKGGRMQKDIWVKTGGKYYFFGSDGAALKEQWVGQYYVGSSGARLTNTWKDNKYLGSSGKAVKGLQDIGGVYFYFNTETYEKVVNTTIELDQATYEFDGEGKGTLVSENKAPATNVAVQKTYHSDPYVDDTTLLAALIRCEAGNQPYEGKLAVGLVVYNRIYSSSFPSKLREIVYQKGQYTPTWDGSLTRTLKNQELISEECRKAAEEAAEMFKEYKKGDKIELQIGEEKIEFPYLFFMRLSSYRANGLTSPYKAIADHVFFEYWK